MARKIEALLCVRWVLQSNTDRQLFQQAGGLCAISCLTRNRIAQPAISALEARMLATIMEQTTELGPSGRA